MFLLGSSLLAMLNQGCAFAPGYGVYCPDGEEWRREVRQKAKATLRAQGCAAEPLSGSCALVKDELSFHLPKPAPGAKNRPRVEVKKRGGLIFGGGVFEVVATGDFTPETTETFVAAARRLQGHLEPVPKFHLALYRETDGGRVAVGGFELK